MVRIHVPEPRKRLTTGESFSCRVPVIACSNMDRQEQAFPEADRDATRFEQSDTVGELARGLRSEHASMDDAAWVERIVSDASQPVEWPEGYVYNHKLHDELAAAPSEGLAHARGEWAPPPPVFDEEQSNSEFQEERATRPQYVFAGGLRWKVGRKIGRGSFGDVYEIRHVGNSQPARVVKIMASRPGNTLRHKMMWNEVGATMASGDFVASEMLHDEKGNVWEAIIMERHTGRSGAYLIHEQTEHERAERYRDVRKMYQLALGLRSIVSTIRKMHDQGWIHRDVKPDNIIVNEQDGESSLSRLIDYGIAVRSGAVRPLARTRKVPGSPAFVLPEAWLEQNRDLRLLDYWGAVLSTALISGLLKHEPEPVVGRIGVRLKAGTYFEGPMLFAPHDARMFFEDTNIAGAHREFIEWIYQFLEPHQPMERRQFAWTQRGTTQNLKKRLKRPDGEWEEVEGDFLDDDKFVRELDEHVRHLAKQAGLPVPEETLALLA